MLTKSNFSFFKSFSIEILSSNLTADTGNISLTLYFSSIDIGNDGSSEFLTVGPLAMRPIGSPIISDSIRLITWNEKFLSGKQQVK